MSGYVRSLALVTVAWLATALLGLTVQECAAAPQAVLAASISAPPSAVRIWYPAGNYPQLSLPDGRREVVRSMLNVTKPMHFGNFVWDEDHIPGGPVWVRIDLTRQLLSVFRGGHEIPPGILDGLGRFATRVLAPA